MFVCATCGYSSRLLSIFCTFPSVDLDDHRRGGLAKVDITVLAPDEEISCPKTTNKIPLRKFTEEITTAELHDDLEYSRYFKEPDPIPIEIVPSERTHHPMHVYLLLVGHTTTKFRIAYDYLLTEKNIGIQKDTQIKTIEACIQSCVYHFSDELYYKIYELIDWYVGVHEPCVGSYMRAQLVIFEALGRLYSGDGEEVEDKDEEEEDENGNLNLDHDEKDDEDEDKNHADENEEKKTVEDLRYWSCDTTLSRRVCKEFGLVLNGGYFPDNCYAYVTKS